MVDENYEVKLSDFGSSLKVERGVCKAKDLVCSTKNYMAPEIFNKESFDPFKADVFSLGVVLYTLIVG